MRSLNILSPSSGSFSLLPESFILSFLVPCSKKFFCTPHERQPPPPVLATASIAAAGSAVWPVTSGGSDSGAAAVAEAADIESTYAKPNTTRSTVGQPTLGSIEREPSQWSAKHSQPCFAASAPTSAAEPTSAAPTPTRCAAGANN